MTLRRARCVVVLAMSLALGVACSAASDKRGGGSARPSSSSSTSSSTSPVPTWAPTASTTTTLVARAAVTELQLRNASLPADTCKDMVGPGVSRKLTDGKSEGTGKAGDVTTHEEIVFRRAALGDLDGDGVGDGVGVYVCDAGGSGAVFAVVAILGDRVVPVDFAKGVESSWEPVVLGAQIDGGKLTLQIATSDGDDAHCCPSRDVTEVLRWSGSDFQRLSVLTVDAFSFAKRLADAINRHDMETVSRLAAPAVVAVVAQEPPPMTAGECHKADAYAQSHTGPGQGVPADRAHALSSRVVSHRLRHLARRADPESRDPW